MITCMQDNPSMFRLRASKFLLLSVLILSQFLSTQLLAQRSKSPWQTLTGEAPLVIARGGFSGLFPDSSVTAYSFVSATSVPDAVLWCDVQLTKDGVGICFPDVTMSKDSNIELIRGILSRSPAFNDNRNVISTVENIATQFKPAGFWLNVQHDAFYAQHNLSMSGFLLSVSKTVTIDYLSSSELKFFRDIGSRFGKTGPKFVFRFLEKDDVEVFLVEFKTFASGSPYETVYQVEETLGDIFDSAIEDIKKLADAVVVSRLSVYLVSASFFLTGQAKLLQLLH
ncbi:hypothetical protein BRARA_I02306 [Brassica rapa]|uniref:glycerophosphodiester phosphodiesterase n=1 Tax=Brassica campestris TaxID=3711 RepID=A0A397Y6V7_BRACM|nr:hypothetical protein BRARA_I02306 [Brassica rapa]